MAKITDTPTADAAADAAPDIALTLDEFCTRLSARDRRVELIGAFASTERRAGVVKDVESAFAARFAAFCTAPA